MYSHLYNSIYCSNIAQPQDLILATYGYDPIIHLFTSFNLALLFLLIFCHYHVLFHHFVYLNTLYKHLKKKKKLKKYFLYLSLTLWFKNLLFFFIFFYAGKFKEIFFFTFNYLLSLLVNSAYSSLV